MAHKAAEQMSVAGSMLEEIANAQEGSLPLEERLAVLTRLRESGMESGTASDQFLIERITRLHEALSEVQEQHGDLRELIRGLTAPPYFPAVFLTAANTPQVQGALVQTDNERRVVQLAEGVALEQLAPGDEVFLSHERNVVIAKSLSPSFLAGEVATYSRSTLDGRPVLRSHDEEVVVLPKTALRDAGLKAGDGVRFSRSTGLAFEKIEASKGEEFFLEATPSDTFHEIGGLDQEIRADGGPAGQRKNKGGSRYMQLACRLVAERAPPLHQREAGRAQLDVVWRHRAALSRYLPHCAGSGGGRTRGAGGHVLGRGGRHRWKSRRVGASHR